MLEKKPLVNVISFNKLTVKPSVPDCKYNFVKINILTLKAHNWPNNLS